MPIRSIGTAWPSRDFRALVDQRSVVATMIRRDHCFWPETRDEGVDVLLGQGGGRGVALALDRDERAVGVARDEIDADVRAAPTRPVHPPPDLGNCCRKVRSVWKAWSISRSNRSPLSCSSSAIARISASSCSTGVIDHAFEAWSSESAQGGPRSATLGEPLSFWQGPVTRHVSAVSSRREPLDTNADGIEPQG